jgi:Region found in RelA / SpoT proteins
MNLNPTKSDPENETHSTSNSPSLDDMAWTVREYSKSAIDRAGETLIEPTVTADARAEAIKVVKNWRSAHAYPLNNTQNRLRGQVDKFEPGTVPVQRLKRLPSIQVKLELKPTMGLSRMQDLGGCRSVVRDMDTLIQIRDVIMANKRSKDELYDYDDYINDPRESGYRSFHAKYKYGGETSDYVGMRTEVQLRTQLQHSWATAVEVVGTYQGTNLKGGQGSDEWLRFFRLMASEGARIEGTTRAPGAPQEDRALMKEIREAAAEKIEYLHQINKVTLRAADLPPGFKFIVLEIPRDENQLTALAFVEIEAASAKYAELETREDVDTVMIGIDKINDLQKAYPNYFRDVTAFIEQIENAIR